MAEVFNYYSSGDDVINEFSTVPSRLNGLDESREMYCWHHQEMGKGRGTAELLGFTTWSGWGFSKDVYVQPLTPLPVTSRRYTAEQAAAATDEQLRANPVFRPYPSSITNSVIPLMTRAAHMTYGVPTLTPPTGGTAFGGLTLGDEMVDLNGVGEGGISKPNGWPQGRRLGSRWTHSDMKDVAFYFVYKFYEKVVEKGGLK